MAQRERIGLVGVGNMGGPMARCLAKAEFPVMLFDAKKEATEPFRAETNLFTVAPDLPTLGAECRTVITMLPDSKIVRMATYGSDGQGGFGSRLAKGSVVIDMSSSYPVDTQKLGAELEAQGVALVEPSTWFGIFVPKKTPPDVVAKINRDFAAILAEPALKERLSKLGFTLVGGEPKALADHLSADIAKWAKVASSPEFAVK